jgi:predicted O-methyltransferase YrrM
MPPKTPGRSGRRRDGARGPRMPAERPGSRVRVGPALLRALLAGIAAAVGAGVVVGGASLLGAAAWSAVVPTAVISGVVAASAFLIRAEVRRALRRTGKVGRHVGRFESEMRDRTAELAALSQLSHLGDPYPLWFGGWALGADGAAELIRQLQARRPARVLETGCGVSTLLIGRYLRDRGDGLVVSLEHDPVWAEATRKHVEAMGIGDFVRIVEAPLEEVTIAGETHRWYAAAEELSRNQPFDLLLIDGPPNARAQVLSPRYPALPQLQACLSLRAIVMVDDAKRPTENRMLERWAVELPAWQQRRLRTVKGMAILERGEP